jgi:aspartate/methionine/tyrosine aminotransferase
MAKSKLPDGYIDLGIGEPRLLCSVLTRSIPIDTVHYGPNHKIWEYAPPNGCESLVNTLERIYKARVVITTGAKQGLLAACAALRWVEDRHTISFRSPYWASIPHVVSHVGMTPIPVTGDDFQAGTEACLLVTPNNPDGASRTYDEAKEYTESLPGLGIPVIHDAAYYTHSYLPADYELGPLGDMQVYSVSKMFGLSGLRLGWVVCHTERYYDALTSYVEAATAGVSTASQKILMDIFRHQDLHPSWRGEFEAEIFSKLTLAKHILMTEVDPDKLAIPKNLVSIPGMFCWAKPAANLDFEKAKIRVMKGDAFGDSEKIRINLAVPLEQLREAIHRINAA